MADAESKPDQLVLVVHGIGDPEAGQTLSLFARSLAEPNRPFEDVQRTIWLSEKHGSEEEQTAAQVKRYPVHQTDVFVEDQSVEMCEAFWGDLSRVRRGWLGVIYGMFQIMFGLRYVAYVAADQPGKAALWLKTLGLMSSRILQGPVAAVTVFLGLLIAAVCGTCMVWQDAHQYALWPQVTVMACGAFAFLAAEIGTRVTRSRVVERFWFWVNATVVFVIGVMMIRLFWLDHHYAEIAHSCEIHPGVMWYCRVLVVLLGILWFIEIQVIVAMALCWIAACHHRKVYRPALTIAFLLPALAIGVWGQLIPMSWLAIRESVGALDNLKHFRQVFDDSIPFLGIQMLMMLLLMIALAVVLVRYAWWRCHNPEASYRRGRKAPRLIVHGALQTMLAISTAIGVALVSSLWLMNTFGESGSYSQTALVQFLTTVNGYAIAAVVPLGGLMIFILPKLRPGFDMILDVANHFYFRPTHVADVLDDDDEFDITESTFENGKLFYSKRESLHGRLRKILAYYRDQYSHHPDLVIISHSQGTMVAIETLNDRDLDWLNNSFRSVTLVTMGSPFTHLYQHYFGHCYPGLDKPFWSCLRRRVDRWVNVFRVDDYVGNEIDFPEQPLPSLVGFEEAVGSKLHSNYRDSDYQSETSIDVPFIRAPDTGTQPFDIPKEYKNISVGPRGHVNYWSDREVLAILRSEVFAKPEEKEQRRAA